MAKIRKMPKKPKKPKSEIQVYNQETMPSNQMLSSFQQMQTKNELAEVIKELFSVEKLLMITDLSSDEIRLVTRIQMIAEMKDIKYWKDGLNLFMKLVLSRDRKSRKEILDAIKDFRQSKSMLQKLNPANWGK